MHRRSKRGLMAIAIGCVALPILAHSGEAIAANVTVDLAATKQVIRGFGASSAWCGTLSTGIMDSLYKDLGYSILRVRMEEGIGDGWSSGNFSAWGPELTNAKNAIARGAIVFASPWNPPASMLSGGKVNTTKYGDYANYLKAYAKYFADNGAPLYAVSIQNEPDFGNSWTSWTATDLLNFLKAEGATLASAFRVMMPESFQFRQPMSDPSLKDATVASYISIIGGHLYGNKITDYPLARNLGKEIWETEHYFDDDQISNIMKLGKEIHDCMVTGNMNAYVYWWITWGNGLANANGTIFKRAYALGQFAKYIRPGYHRVDATESPAQNVSVSAYQGQGKVVVVAVNTGSSSVNQNFVLRGGSATQVSSWQTNSGSNMAAGQNYQVSNGTFAAPLAGQSITTFVASLEGFVEPDGGASDGVAGVGGRDAGESKGDGGAGAGGHGGTGGTGVLSTVGGSSGTGGASVASEANGGGSTGRSISGVASGGASSSSGATGGEPNSSVGRAGGSTASGPSSGSRPAESKSSGCSCALLSGRAPGPNADALGSLFALLGLALLRSPRQARTEVDPSEPGRGGQEGPKNEAQ